MRDDDHRRAVVGQLAHHGQHLVGELGIERRGRLVEQHHLRLHRQRARDRDALLLAAGQSRRILAGLFRKVHAAQAFLAQRAWPALRDSPRTRYGASMTLPSTVMCGHRLNCWNTMPRSRRIRLISDERPRLALAARIAAIAQRLAVDEDVAGRRRLEVVDAAQERALARAAGADHADDVAAVNVERHALQHFERAETLVQVDDANRRHSLMALPLAVPRARMRGDARTRRHRIWLRYDHLGKAMLASDGT